MGGGLAAETLAGKKLTVIDDRRVFAISLSPSIIRLWRLPDRIRAAVTLMPETVQK